MLWLRVSAIECQPQLWAVFILCGCFLAHLEFVDLQGKWGN
jgi:hypothetical protein